MHEIFQKLNGIETLVLLIVVVVCATGVLVSLIQVFHKKPAPGPESHPVFKHHE
jgi:hypothetical protein